MQPLICSIRLDSLIATLMVQGPNQPHAVDPDFRGRGDGQKMIAGAEKVP
jgi:hypothetical protein